MKREYAELLHRFVMSNRPDPMEYAYSFSGLPSEAANEIWANIEAEYAKVLTITRKMVQDAEGA